MRKSLPMLYLFTFCIAVSCRDEGAPARSLITEADQEFVINAADEGLFQISAGQIALNNDASAQYASFGQLMIDGYTASNQQLQTFATSNNLDIPTTLSDEKQQRLDTLAGRKGMELDTVYAAAMVNTHTETIEYFESQAAVVTDLQLKNWIESRLPDLRRYLDQARALNDSLK